MISGRGHERRHHAHHPGTVLVVEAVLERPVVVDHRHVVPQRTVGGVEPAHRRDRFGDRPCGHAGADERRLQGLDGVRRPRGGMRQHRRHIGGAGAVLQTGHGRRDEILTEVGGAVLGEDADRIADPGRIAGERLRTGGRGAEDGGSVLGEMEFGGDRQNAGIAGSGLVEHGEGHRIGRPDRDAES